ncbi:MAG: NTP transferase domain-containing protein [Actinomycetota bacterium]|nr:NTP transferase domain-containing protein [Actinomycetota bacterium]
MTVAAVVLAAGGASRWDGQGHKLLAELDGQPLASWAIEAASAASLDELVIVTGSTDLAELIPTDATVVHNPNWTDGQASSLQVAVTACRVAGHHALVVGLADMPGVLAETWRAVAGVSEPLATATFAGQRRPPVKIVEELWDELPTVGDQGARGLIADGVYSVTEVACDGRGDDVDTVGDLETWN